MRTLCTSKWVKRWQKPHGSVYGNATTLLEILKDEKNL